MSTIRRGALLLGAVLLGLSFSYPSPSYGAERELNLLSWTGYEERAMLDIFEELHDVKVNYKTFVGADQMFALLTQSQGQYDVVVIDPEYIEKLHAAGRLAPLDPAGYDFSDYFEPFRKFPLAWIDGKLYAVVVEFGSNGIVYNTDHLTDEDVETWDILWDPKVEGKVGIWDWYLPNMGVISRSLGNQVPYDITDEQLAAVRDRLDSLRSQVTAIHPNPPEMLSALANGQTWIVPAGGEWVAAILQQQGHPINWTVPKEGGIMWMDALGIPNDAPNPDVAKLYIQWMQTPEAQALLSQKQAYQSSVPNRKAYDLLTDAQKDTLRIHDEEDALDLLSRLSVRSLPIQQSEATWQDIWEEFKTGK